MGFLFSLVMGPVNLILGSINIGIFFVDGTWFNLVLGILCFLIGALETLSLALKRGWL